MRFRFWIRVIGIILLAGVFYVIGWCQCWARFSRESPFHTTSTRMDFENERWLLKRETVNRSPAFPFDVSRWVVTMTDKSSGHSIALLTAHPSFPPDSVDDSLTFSQTADGFSYTSDVASFAMKWPDIDFHYQKGFEDFGGSIYLGAPRE